MNNISITFRHVDPSDAIKAHAEIDATHVAVAHLEAHEVCEDMYMAIDRAVQKLERQIAGHKGSLQAKQRRGGTLRTGESPEPAEDTIPET